MYHEQHLRRLQSHRPHRDQEVNEGAHLLPDSKKMVRSNAKLEIQRNRCIHHDLVLALIIPIITPISPIITPIIPIVIQPFLIQKLQQRRRWYPMPMVVFVQLCNLQRFLNVNPIQKCKRKEASTILKMKLIDRNSFT